ncbi:DUF952 domain-containing protein [Rhodobacteraceae bacterium NNCM2]|nr:DUF952 domain-containing protein [Coraliihabitans acroporae]
MIIYKILTAEQWQDLQARGQTSGAPVDIADGFIHFSTADQVRETAERHFAGQKGLWLLAYKADGMEALEWEPSRGGDLFPHLYGPLSMEGLVASVELKSGPEGFVFPGGIA